MDKKKKKENWSKVELPGFNIFTDFVAKNLLLVVLKIAGLINGSITGGVTMARFHYTPLLYC